MGTERGDEAGSRPAHPGSDLGRRVLRRREELGLTREDVATRARLSSGYLEYVESQAGVVSMEALMAVADALETTVSALLGAGTEQPQGKGPLARSPVLEELSLPECREKLSSGGIGRVVFSTADAEGPEAVPVNFRLVGDAIVFRTAAGGALAGTVGSDVAFEVDRVDEARSEGWSILVRGVAEPVIEPEEQQHLRETAGPLAWAGGERDTWVRIPIGRTTGRRIRSGL
ncbi:helix-turn-helix domain-containing protein [Streptomyces telluris]|uniref:Pyridoxamine 5'-phosphate oxidase family protein n=1 Tax=Streptomyces telluris TaxID=2720021 RepID=A0A9X2LFT7_9ACTN|nr:pyridoxamine 5'-phosphate oxidase family protein [Streptomyces telluris]MCQ8770509.1 pyridoxamine 5'-phosphate oxidase family protein [Streptomyces telluris]NJP78867.1 helix-turn-helix domain-containing protein [Streptomyces telluris]